MTPIVHLAVRVAALFALLVPATDALAETVFATEGNYPPWNETVDGKLTGFDVELIARLCAAMTEDCRMVTATFPGMMDRLAAGAFDGIVSGIAITAERERRIAFTRPYMSLSVAFATARPAEPAPATTGETLARFGSARIGAQRDTVNAALVRSLLPNATLVLYDDQTELTAAVRAGTVDAGLAATETWLHAPAAPAPLVVLGPPFASADYPILGRGLAIGIARENAALKTRLDTAICRLTGDGTVGRLSVKWFGTDLSVPCSDKPN